VVGDHLESRVFDIRKSDGRSQMCVSYQQSKHVRFQQSPSNNTANAASVMGQSSTAALRASSNGGKQNTVRDELRAWRDNFTFKEAMQELQDDTRDKEWTVAILFSGGLLDTFAAVRSGFTPIWGCETNHSQRRMWEKFTNCANIGDVFGPKVINQERPMYIKSGAPCPDYSRSGSHLGAKGETGWMFEEQANVIETLQPWCFCLEISEHALFVNNGEEVLKVRKQLGKDYVCKSKIMWLWTHGDPSNRRRLFMVGFHRELGQAAFEFQFPRGSFDEERWPSARDISVSDEEVPARYWRSDSVPTTGAKSGDFKPAKLHKIGSKGDSMGPASLPNAVYSWDGLLNGQTTLNGGGRRPTLDWKLGESIEKTRLVVPKETVAAASLPHDYLEFSKAFAEGDEDDYLRLCVNNGVPIRIGVALDSEIKKVLTRGIRRLDKPNERYASLLCIQDIIRSMLFDSGANGSLNHRDVESYLIDSVKSAVYITVADGGGMKGYVDGKLKCMVVNTANHKGFPEQTPMEFSTTTTSGLAMELLSFDEFYRDGWGVHLRPPDIEGGVCEMYRPKRNNIAAANVPLRYDWDGSGGFYLDYILKKWIKAEHQSLLAATFQDNFFANSAFGRSQVKYLDVKEVRAMADTKSKDVVEVIIGQMDNDYDIRGVKAGLRSNKSKLSELDFHKLYGHLGFCPGCKVCSMSKGASRRIKVKVDPHRETRPGHTWCMDTVTMSHRSEKGNKFLTVLRCEASNKFKLFCHYLKSDIRDMIETWIQETRADPAFHDTPYKMVSRIKLDNAGEWSLECNEWQAMVKELGVDCVYSCPDRKESNAHAERSCGIVEVVIKSTLYEANLPPSWWEYASHTAEFLLNRFPVTSQNVSVPMDGDRARPLEIYTRGGYSRRQIDRELSYFVGLGTPCLVQTKEKGVRSIQKQGGGYALACTEIKCASCAPTPRASSDQNPLQRFVCGRVLTTLNFWE
jgi:site-specific DNA-cytosine methylase